MNQAPLVVVLDLDETLIHSSKDVVNLEHYAFDSEEEATHVRTGAVEFVQKLLNDSRFRVMVWTSANETYANHIVTSLGFSLDQFERVWHSKFLNKRELDLDDPEWGRAQYRNEKDLLKVRRSLKTPLSRIVAIDDKARFFYKQYSNLVIVPEYKGQEDNIFPKVFEFLSYLHAQDNVRPLEKRGWMEKSWTI